MKLTGNKIQIVHWLMAFMMLLINYRALSQVPSCVWAKNAGGTQHDYGHGLSVNPNGNIMVTGYFFSSTASFDTTTLTNTNFYEDIFIAKYNDNGNLIWAKSAGGSNEDDALGIASDNYGNTYITGYFVSPTIAFDSIILNNVFGHDVFLTKYDSLGNVVWAKSAGGNNWEEAYNVATDSSGNVYITGRFGSTSLAFGSTILNNTGSVDIFVAKYDSNGNPQWAKSATGSFGDSGHNIACDATGNVYITGNYGSTTLNIGGVTLLNDTTDQSPDVFISKYDSNGNVIWAKSINGKGRDEGTGITTDLTGNVYVTGFFRSDSLKVGPYDLINSNAGTDDIFIAKYDSTGNEQWAKSFGGSGYDWPEEIKADPYGNLLVAGEFTSPALGFGSTILNNWGNNDAFLTNYDLNGNVNWAKGFGGTGSDVCWGLGFSNSDIYLTGYFSSTSASFGSITLSTNGGADMYLTKLSLATGIEEFNLNNYLTAYPNPSYGNMELSFKENILKGNIYIFNSTGSLVYSDEFNGNQKSIPSKFSHGVYFVKVSNSEKTWTSKFLIIE